MKWVLRGFNFREVKLLIMINHLSLNLKLSMFIKVISFLMSQFLRLTGFCVVFH